MKDIIRIPFTAAAVLALASMGAYAQNATSTTIGLTATVSSFDNITCTQSTVDLNNGVAIVASGLTTGHAVNCFVTSNDVTAVDVTAYLPITSPLTGTTTPANTIANTNIQWSATAGGTFAPFAALTATGLTADDGAIVASSVLQGDATAVDFFLKLNVPIATPADTYSATMTVAITPHV
jgi:hypothetical protein